MFNIPEGEMRGVRLHASTPAINASFSKEDIAKLVASQNNHQTIDGILNGDTTLHTVITESGGQVTTMIPTAPYGEISVMTVARGPESLSREKLQTEFIYDYPYDVQFHYWSQLVTSLQALEDMAANHEHRESLCIVGTENCIKSISTEKHPTSRSIPVPHAQVSVSRIDTFEPVEVSEKPFRRNLELEQRLLKNPHRAEKFVRQVDAEMEKLLGTDIPDKAFRMHKPYGYTFSPSENNSIDAITTIMQVHHKAYSTVMESYEPILQQAHEKYGQQIIPQPSYRLYMCLEEGRFTVTICPEILSNSGVMEAAGVIPSRSSEHTPQLPQAEKDFAITLVRTELQNVYNRTSVAAD